MTAAWVRPLTSSAAKTRSRWVMTVASAMTGRRAFATVGVQARRSGAIRAVIP